MSKVTNWLGVTNDPGKTVTQTWDQGQIDDSYGRSVDVYGQQNTLAQQLAAIASGQGPNPALEQLKQTTGQNIQQASGMIGSQKGINPALAARLAAQNAASANQTAAGQAATLSAQQQLAAREAQAGVLGTMGTQGIGQQGVLQGAAANMNSARAGVAGANSGAMGGIFGGLLSGLGGAGAKAATGGSAPVPAWTGGEIPAMNQGGPTSDLGMALMGGMAEGGPVFAADGGVPGRADVPGDSPANDKVPAMLSPGEIVIPRSHATPEKAASFVEALQRRNGSGDGYAKVVKARMACGGKV